MTLGTIGVGDLGLAPTDPCYDANRAWYQPDLWITDAECACMAANNYPIGQQCATPTGVATVTGNTIGALFGGAAKGVGDASGMTGLLVFAGIGLLAVMLFKK